MTRLLSILVLKIFVIHEKIAFGSAEPLIREDVSLTVEAGPDEFPFVVSIGWERTKEMSEEETHFCGGALITQIHVLTAMHCKFFVNDIDEVRVRIGSNDLMKSKKYKIETWDTYDAWVYQNFNGSRRFGGNDLSVITLSETVKIQPADISDVEIDEWVGKKAVTAGWGLKKNDKRTRFMEKADLTVLSRDKCNELIKKANLADEEIRVPPRFLCTNAEPYVLLGCGDSGGPLIVNKRTIIGVNRSSCPKKTNDDSEKLNLHVGLHDYMDFIMSVTENTKSKSLFQCKNCRGSVSIV